VDAHTRQWARAVGELTRKQLSTTCKCEDPQEDYYTALDDGDGVWWRVWYCRNCGGYTREAEPL